MFVPIKKIVDRIYVEFTTSFNPQNTFSPNRNGYDHEMSALQTIFSSKCPQILFHAIVGSFCIAPTLFLVSWFSHQICLDFYNIFQYLAVLRLHIICGVVNIREFAARARNWFGKWLIVFDFQPNASQALCAPCKIPNKTQTLPFHKCFGTLSVSWGASKSE